jgi:hypothetical protein
MSALLGLCDMWHPSLLPLLVHYYKLWKYKYLEHYEHLYEVFITHLYELVFRKSCIRFFEEALVVLDWIGDWYSEQNTNYLCIYESTLAPHILSKHALDRLVPMEIAYQSVRFIDNAKLKDHKKGMFLSYTIAIKAFTCGF